MRSEFGKFFAKTLRFKYGFFISIMNPALFFARCGASFGIEGTSGQPLVGGSHL
jgi:hypothetical protein